MTISLDQLAGFVAVAEEGHFGRAAERLRMTQPPLSRQVQKLEREVGAALLDRTSRGASLTPAGVALLAEARRLLALAEAAPRSARRVAEGRAGRLAVGFTATAALSVLGRVLAEADAVLPDVVVELGEHVSATQLDRLRDGRLDLGLLREAPVDGEFRTRVVHRERFVAALPVRHPLAASAREVRVADLADADMISYDPTAARYFDELSAAVLRGVRPRSVQRVAQVHSMLALVAAGRGIALVPESIGALHWDGVTLRPVDGWPDPVVVLRAVWREDGTNPVVARALDALSTLRER
ncbi:LysR family transcriptional regulator [Arenivirga flava]|uniref:LysR family transcriptional regulator n=1 Tax=Arenivirga flava TaxID=1930060 RepID=A0AA37UJ50_9MICO|nr:LysR family transcriptional regulator [Arenivirga flava]GMA27890.1 LysR family transcriptional regulator [Arenivirga flava]